MVVARSTPTGFEEALPDSQKMLSLEAALSCFGSSRPMARNPQSHGVGFAREGSSFQDVFVGV